MGIQDPVGGRGVRQPGRRTELTRRYELGNCCGVWFSNIPGSKPCGKIEQIAGNST